MKLYVNNRRIKTNKIIVINSSPSVLLQLIFALPTVVIILTLIIAMIQHDSVDYSYVAATSETSTLPSALSSISKTASFLIPSQIISSSKNKKQNKSHDYNKDRSYQHRHFLVPSQTIHRSNQEKIQTSLESTSRSSRSSEENEDNNGARPTIATSSSKNSNRNRISYATWKNPSLIVTMNDNNQINSIGTTENDFRYNTKKQNQSYKQKQKHQKFRYTGNLPDVYWRAIPMEHLRAHPCFKQLQYPEEIKQIEKLEDVKYFRQDSWQWDMLHAGRCTTSQATPALGMLEPNAATLLQIPKSLQKGCMGAYHRLNQDALRSLEEMNTVLCNHDVDSGHDYVSDSEDQDLNNSQTKSTSHENDTSICNTSTSGISQNSRKIWKAMPSKRYNFAAKYYPEITQSHLNQRRDKTKKFMSTLSSPMKIRMKWGNSQEATAILTALNYFTTIDPGVIVTEIGMCGAGLKYNSTSKASRLILGASPDAVIEYSNGTIEVLEVKNHCPFVPKKRWTNNQFNSTNNKNYSKNGDDHDDRYRIREMPLRSSVPPAYIPQLMMEMLCLGDSCRSAIMVRQTATNGAIIVRLHRDDKWIDDMIYWLERFMEDYVEKGQPPPSNFFWFDKVGNDLVKSKRYQAFLERTKELSDEAEVVKFVKHKDIQRVLSNGNIRLPLFLD